MKKVLKIIISFFVVGIIFININVLTTAHEADSNSLKINEASAYIPPIMHWPDYQPCFFPPYGHYYCIDGNTGCIETFCNYPQ